ncbi:MAG: pyruvate, phosphate dikinase [Hyphomicrobiaceae bacterium]|nr:pyruvate, phosphate dikinase [Hyphomicrobiaceae bacterium]
MTRGSSAAAKGVYLFGTGTAEGDADMSELLGGKGANLAEMASLGLPVPPGFTITTEVCAAYYASDEKLPDSLKPEVLAAIDAIGKAAGRTFGDEDNPLLVAVRSGSRASMPGMMDTILNLGLNARSVKTLAKKTGDERFAYDSYRRFIEMYADVVLNVDQGVFVDLLDNFKNLNGMSLDTDLTAEDWREIIEDYQEAIEAETGTPFPEDTSEQLWGAIAAVFGSWQNPRAIIYRRMHSIPDSWGTAVTVQAMVFGNMSERSATGVAFTRNPSTGEKELYGEFLPKAQGEDVVAGIRTPQPLTEAAAESSRSPGASLEALMPDAMRDLRRVFDRLEKRYRDMQDVEFTIENGKLWMLQTRSAKRTAQAAIKVAVDFVKEGVLTMEEALLSVDAQSLTQLLHPTIEPDALRDLLVTGLPASPGAASGEIVFNAAEAEALKVQGRQVILVRTETSPEDIHGMVSSVGILTARGGMTSHAAVVARGMGLPCVAGAGQLRIDEEAGEMRVGQKRLVKGDIITIDGASGQVINGRAPMRMPELSGDFATLIAWADKVRRLKVRANADTPRDALKAKTFGAEGIGLARTEHMFFDSDRILAMREMVCASDEPARRAALARILPMQRQDFVELFEIMEGAPVTIRLLDPPLHEFLPRQPREIEALAKALGITLEKLTARIAELTEFNPMLGFRGCRLHIRYPEITEVQARAIFEAAIIVSKKTGKTVVPEIMIPLVAWRQEFDILAVIIKGMAEAVQQETGSKVEYQLGTMIEVPRSALCAGEIAAEPNGAEFFSFGTNDLTQTTLGLSRDDAAPILANYAGRGMFEAEPFITLDHDGVGELVRIAMERGRRWNRALKVGICGEHGGDPASIAFFDRAGLDYVSCSPFRLPVARLAAAQSALRGKMR